MPVELDGLQQWGVGDRMLRDLLAGRSPDDTLAKEWRRVCCRPGGSAGGWPTGCSTRPARWPSRPTPCGPGATPRRSTSPSTWAADAC